MISSVGSATQMQAIQSTQSTQAKMTADQKDQLQELLGEFSVDSFSSDDATSMVDAIKEIGIVPGQELEDIMADSGFDAKSIGDMAGAGMPPPPPPPQSSGENSSEMLSFLEELLEQYDGEISSDNKDSILAAVQEKFGIEDIDSLISVQA
jgi:hypothetical protein